MQATVAAASAPQSEVVTRRACPVCGGRRASILHTQPFVLPAATRLPHAHDIVACEACGMVFSDATATQDNYDSYYARGAKYADATVGTGSGICANDRRRIEELVDRLEPHLNQDARIVDIGCAAGGVLAELRRRGYRNLLGIDPAPACVEQVQALGIAASVGSLTQLSHVALECEMMLLSHVLEHVWDVAAFMQTLDTSTRAGARVYAEVPDARRYRVEGYVPFYFFDPEHVNHFDETSLASLFMCHGWMRVASGSVGLPLAGDLRYPAVWALLAAGGEPSGPAARSSAPQAVAAYVAASAARARFPQIEELARTRRPVVLWGAGSFARRLLATTPLASCALLRVVDSDREKQGQRLAGHTIVAPESLRAVSAPILVCAAVGADSVVAQIRALGLGNEVIVLGQP